MLGTAQADSIDEALTSARALATEEQMHALSTKLQGTWIADFTVPRDHPDHIDFIDERFSRSPEDLSGIRNERPRNGRRDWRAVEITRLAIDAGSVGTIDALLGKVKRPLRDYSVAGRVRARKVGNGMATSV